MTTQLSFKVISLFALIFAMIFQVFPQNKVGIFEDHKDIGKVKHPGSATYDQETYTIKASGTNIWGPKDEFHFVWKKMKGDFILTAQVALQGKGVDPHRKLGWMVRTDLDSNSTNINAVVHGDGLTSLQYRKTKGGDFQESKSTITGAEVVQLERRQGKYIMHVAKFGDTFTITEVSDVNLGDEVFVGLFVCAHNPDVVESGMFKNVKVTIPAKPDFVPYKDYIGITLEMLDVQTGARKVLFASKENIEAPNSTMDGKILKHQIRLWMEKL
jgi:TolB protein